MGAVTCRHWHFNVHTRVNGVDLSVAADDLGHIHLDGEIQLATTPEQSAELVTEGLSRSFGRLSGRRPTSARWE